jgi:hypothetical protein
VENSRAWHEIQELGLHVDKLADGLTTPPVGSSAANCHRLIKYAADPVNTDQFNERVVALNRTQTTAGSRSSPARKCLDSRSRTPRDLGRGLVQSSGSRFFSFLRNSHALRLDG